MASQFNPDRLNVGLLEALLVEIAKHQERHERDSFSDSDAQNKCAPVLQKVKKVLELVPRHFLSSAPDSPRILIASQVLRTVLAGEFCQHASAVFGYGQVVMIGSPLSHIIHLICAPNVARAALDDLLRTLNALMKMLTRQNSALYLSCLADSLSLLGACTRSPPSPPAGPFFPSLGDNAVHLDPGSPSALRGSCLIFASTASVPLGPTVHTFNVGLRVLVDHLDADTDGSAFTALRQLLPMCPTSLADSIALSMLEAASKKTAFPDCLASALDLPGVHQQWARPTVALLQALYKHPTCVATRSSVLRLFSRLVPLRPELIMSCPDLFADPINPADIPALASILDVLASLRPKRPRLSDDSCTPDDSRAPPLSPFLHAANAIIDRVCAAACSGEPVSLLLALQGLSSLELQHSVVVDVALNSLLAKADNLVLCQTLGRLKVAMAMRPIQKILSRLPNDPLAHSIASELYPWGDDKFRSACCAILIKSPLALWQLPLQQELSLASPRLAPLLSHLSTLISSSDSVEAVALLRTVSEANPACAHRLLPLWLSCHGALFSSPTRINRESLVVLFAHVFRSAASNRIPLTNVSSESAESLLRLLTDDDSMVRRAMATHVSFLVEPSEYALLRLIFRQAKEIDNLGAMMVHLRDLVKNSPASARRHLLQAVGSIGCAAHLKFSVHGATVGLNLVQWSLHVLAEQWTRPDASKADLALAVEQLRRIAQAHAMEPRALFEYCKTDLYPKLFATLLMGPPDALGRFLLDAFGDASSTRVEHALSQALPVLLPSLWMSSDLAILEKVALLVYPNAQASTSQLVRKLTVDNLVLWIVPLVDLRAKDEARGGQVWKRILAASSFSFKELLLTGCKTVLSSVVLKLVDRNGARDSSSENALAVLAKSTREDKSVAGLVKTNFMFMMGVLSERVQENWAVVAQRRQALRCVGRLLELMGDDEPADPFVPKVLPTLRSGLENVELQSSAVQSLRILTAKLSDEALRANLSVIVVSLLPCLGGLPHVRSGSMTSSSSSATTPLDYSQSQASSSSAQDEAVQLLTWLIVDHRAVLQDTFREIQELLPPHPALARVTNALNEHVGVRTYRQRLAQLAMLINNESDTIKLMALHELHNVLKTHSKDLQVSILNDDGMDAVSAVLGSLLRTARSVGARAEASVQTKAIGLACCKCLGELGAIDPARLNLQALDALINDTSVDLYDEKGLDLGNRALAAKLLSNFLVKALRSAPDPASHMHVGFAIQELVRFFKNNSHESFALNVPDGEDAGLAELRDLLVSHTRSKDEGEALLNTIRPFALTNYDFEGRWVPPEPRARQGTTFFGPGVPFATSVGDWVANLTARTRGPQSAVFFALRGLRASDSATRTLLFILPYVIQNVLSLGESRDAEDAKNEIRGVLKDGIEDSEEQTGTGRVQLSVQAIFVLLDTLSLWETRMNALMRSGGGGKAHYRYSGDFEDKHRVSELLKQISQRELAEAAFRCGAFSRALMYFERYLRARHARDVGGGGVARAAWRADERVQFERDEIEFLHKIFAAIETEPDGLEGVARLRAQHDGGMGTGALLVRYKPAASKSNSVGSQPTLVEQISELEHASRWDEALLCYEEAIDFAENRHEAKERLAVLHEGQLRCLWRAGHLELLVSLGEGKLVRRPWLRPVVVPYTLDALWRLGRWEELERALKQHQSPQQSEVTRCGAPGGVSSEYTRALAEAVLLASQFKRDPDKDPRPCIERARLIVLEMLSAASMESYGRAYPLLMRLHGLTELDDGSVVQSEDWWKARLNMTAPLPALRDELLAVRRASYRIQDLWSLEVDSWLSLAKTARTSGDVHTCESALLMLRRRVAETSDADQRVTSQAALWRARIQRAELLKDLGQTHQALQALEVVELDNLMAQPLPKGEPPQLLKAKAKALLLATRIMADSWLVQGLPVVERFKRVNELRPDWERGRFRLAKYLDYLMQSHDPREDEQARRRRVVEMLPSVLIEYGATLKAGHAHLFETLPRLLTLWFGYADMMEGGGPPSSAAVTATAAAGKGGSASKLKKKDTFSSPNVKDEAAVNPIMLDLVRALPSRLWYSSLAQLVSRICHPNKDVWEICKTVLVKILLDFPSQALWQVVGVTQSKVEGRRLRANQVLDELAKQLRARGKGRQDQIEATRNVFELLIKVATAKVVDKSVLEIDSIRDVGPMLAVVKASRLVIPTQRHLFLSAADMKDGSEMLVPLLESLEKRAEIMQSKEKPKKIQLRSVDGQLWTFLCKNERNGDLRKDSRLMEFNSVVNQLLARDAQANRRKLRLRTYAVVCLNEECGLLEWVPNTIGFRAAVSEVYAQEDDVKSIKHIARYRQTLITVQTTPGMTKERRVEEFRKIVDEFPPRFHRWFLVRFADPAAWFAARTSYTRSAAVWSMVGHIVGLGDRHAENLLLDSKTGECVHVDFDCLFDKGLSLQTPEIVPFRLTHNMVDALGLVGVEGPFRMSCEVALGVLRSNKDMLLSVLDSFVVDPLVEWSRNKVESVIEAGVSSQEARKKAGKLRLEQIEERLSGISRDREEMVKRLGKATSPVAGRKGVTVEQASGGFDAVPLSVQGQVQKLIEEAVSEDRLSRMFVGWCSFI